MREWLLGLAPVALILYFLAFPASLGALLSQANHFLH